MCVCVCVCVSVCLSVCVYVFLCPQCSAGVGEGNSRFAELKTLRSESEWRWGTRRETHLSRARRRLRWDCGAGWCRAAGRPPRREGHSPPQPSPQPRPQGNPYWIRASDSPAGKIHSSPSPITLQVVKPQDLQRPNMDLS